MGSRQLLSSNLLFGNARALFLTALLCLMPVCEALGSLINEQAGAWTVGPINVNSDYRKQYCSMKNKFQNGHDIVFARDIARVNSVAVDVKKKVFQPGRPYQVVLKVGSVAREMTAISPNNHILLVNMGKDSAFYEALAAGDYLTVSYIDQEAHYALAGSADALDALQECVENLSVGKQFSAVPVQKSAPKKTEKLSSQKKSPDVTLLKDELDALKKENLALQKKNEELKKAVAKKSSFSTPKVLPTVEPAKEKRKTTLETETKEKLPAGKGTLLDKVLSLSRIMPSVQVRHYQEANSRVWGYTWQEQNMRVKAESRQAEQGQVFEDVFDIVLKERSHACKSDFAHASEPVVVQGQRKTMSAEIACIGGGEDYAESIFMVMEGTDAAIISYSSEPGNVQSVLRMRDDLKSRLQ